MPSAHNSPCSPLWNTWAIQKTSTFGQLSCICIISEEMKFLSQFYTVLALSKGCCVGKWFGRLRQNQLCSLWPHSAISKPWKTSLDVVTATTAETEKTELQNGTAKAQDNHFHSHPSLPAEPQLITSRALHAHPSSILSPVVGATSLLNPATVLGSPELALVYYSPYRN